MMPLSESCVRVGSENDPLETETMFFYSRLKGDPPRTQIMMDSIPDRDTDQVFGFFSG